jgi:aspartyl-tRNA(Asn)/glutamyl-tRNA(Gln) amidotransferase subunit A
MNREILNRSLLEHSKALDAREYSSRELTDAYIDMIEDGDREINAYISVCADVARKEADASDERRRKGESRGLLDGIPYAAKDNIAARDVKLTCGSAMLENYISPYDATVIAKLRERGAILLGKTNLDEFAMGTGSENSHFGRVKNPLDQSRVPGGSSGGSAAAVASGEACFALGTDTGGSVRQPAAYCGLVGLRPTYSSLSRYGLVAFSPSLDAIGMLTRTVSDCAVIFGAVAEKDAKDSTTSEHPCKDFCADLDGDLRGVRIAMIKEASELELDERVRRTLERSAEILRSLGAVVETVSLSCFNSSYASYYTISSAEVCSNLSRFDGVRYGYRSDGVKTLEELYVKSRSKGFGEEVKRRILFGSMALSKNFKGDIYEPAILARARIRQELENIHGSYDAILLPTSSTVAYSAGERKNLLFDAYTKDDLLCALASLAGLPALSVPDKCANALPTAIQLVGAKYSEKKLFNIAHRLINSLD